MNNLKCQIVNSQNDLWVFKGFFKLLLLPFDFFNEELIFWFKKLNKFQRNNIFNYIKIIYLYLFYIII